MSDDISPERQKEVIEQVAKAVVRYDLEDIVDSILEGTAPFGQGVGELGVMLTYPFMVTFFGNFGSDLINMLGFDYTNNANKLRQRIAELKEEKKQLQATEQMEKGKSKEKKSRVSRLKSYFKR